MAKAIPVNSQSEDSEVKQEAPVPEKENLSVAKGRSEAMPDATNENTAAPAGLVPTSTKREIDMNGIKMIREDH